MLEQLTRDVRPSLYALAAAVVALLFVACGNAAGLLIGGALERQHEFATRLALGASRSRIVRQIVAENLVLGLIAAGAGFALALWAGDFLVGAAAAAGVPRASDIRIGFPAFVAGVVLSLACTTVCALTAGVAVTRARDLRVGPGARSTTPRRGLGRASFIGIEAALSLALLVAAALLIRSFYALQLTNPGFEAAHLLTTRLSVPQARYPAGPTLADLYARVLERVKALPGVEAASVVDWLPTSGFGASVPFRAPRADAQSQAALAELRVVGPDYFRTLGIPLVAGRTFDRRDVNGAPSVIAINASFARAYFGSDRSDRPAADARSRWAARGRDRRRRRRRARARAATPARTWHLRAEHSAAVAPARDARPRHPREPPTLQPLPPRSTRCCARSNRTFRDRRFNGWKTSSAEHWRVQASTRRPSRASPLTAVFLAGFGIYGTVTSAVAERRRELGVRLALGASRRDVLVRAAGCGLTPTLLGLAAGVPLALAAGRIVRDQLYGVGPSDWPTILAVVGIMTAVALVAALAPAVRATRIDPVLVLKHEAGG